MSDVLSYDGLDEADLIHALYHGTCALGMGILHDTPHLTVEQVRKDFGLDAPVSPGFRIRIDYYCGRPLKTTIDRAAKTITTRLYDRDAGEGQAQRVVERLRSRGARAVG